VLPGPAITEVQPFAPRARLERATYCLGGTPTPALCRPQRRTSPASETATGSCCPSDLALARGASAPKVSRAPTAACRSPRWERHGSAVQEAEQACPLRVSSTPHYRLGGGRRGQAKTPRSPARSPIRVLPLALLLGFTWPTTCRVKTTRRKPCGNASYGFLFGSGKTPGHWRYKFLYQLGLQREVIKPLQPRKRNGSYAVMYQDTPEVNPIRVTVEDNGLRVCGFWVGVVAAVAALI
jgi:hypothetical protein